MFLPNAGFMTRKEQTARGKRQEARGKRVASGFYTSQARYVIIFAKSRRISLHGRNKTEDSSVDHKRTNTNAIEPRWHGTNKPRIKLAYQGVLNHLRVTLLHPSHLAVREADLHPLIHTVGDREFDAAMKNEGIAAFGIG